jgi:hypothetical protein
MQELLLGACAAARLRDCVKQPHKEWETLKPALHHPPCVCMLKDTCTEAGTLLSKAPT